VRAPDRSGRHLASGFAGVCRARPARRPYHTPSPSAARFTPETPLCIRRFICLLFFGFTLWQGSPPPVTAGRAPCRHPATLSGQIAFLAGSVIGGFGNPDVDHDLYYEPVSDRPQGFIPPSSRPRQLPLPRCRLWSARSRRSPRSIQHFRKSRLTLILRFSCCVAGAPAVEEEKD